MFKEERLAEHIAPASSHAPAAEAASGMWERIPDPEPAMAVLSPEKLLAFLFVSPRPCSAVEALFGND